MKIVFMGTPHAAVPSLVRLIADGHQVVAVYTQPDRPSGRGNKITYSPVKECALSHSIAVLQPTKIRTAEALAEVQAFGADAAVVVAYGRILPEVFLTAFPRGAINVHFSLLPKYRGAAPVNWAIVNGETVTGVTTMQMDAGLDTGPILLQEEMAIGSDDTSITLMEKLSYMGADLLSLTMSELDTIIPSPQNGSDATFAPIMKREDGLIDWTATAGRITDRVRGFQPFPGSFTSFHGGKLTIWKAHAIDAAGQPGEILEAAGDRLIVACGGGTALKIEEIQAEGKRRMSVRDLLNGTKLQVGEILGT